MGGRIGGARMDKKLTKSFFREDGQSKKIVNSKDEKSNKNNQKVNGTNQKNNNSSN